MCLPLPGSDSQGRKVVLTRWVYDPRETLLDDLMKASMMIFDVWMEEDEEASVMGLVVLEDVQELSLSHLASFTPSFAKKSLVLFQVFFRHRK